MAKCPMCKKYGLHDFMLCRIDPIDPTVRVCISCYSLIKKYGKAKAREIISINERHNNKRGNWNAKRKMS